jgi:nitrous oxidase accessory protein
VVEQKEEHGMISGLFRTSVGLWIAGLIMAPSVRARTLVVSPAGPLTTVRQAIATASPGDIVRIERGTYQGNIVVDKALALEGIGRPIIRGDGRGSVVTVTADECGLRGLVVEHGGAMLVDEDSGILLKSNHNKLEQNELRDVLFGIYLYGSNDNLISQNRISGRPGLEIGERGNAIHIWNSTHNKITGNTLTGSRDGMYLQNASNSTIRGNRVYDLRYGLHYMSSDDNLFEDNVFEHNVAGAAIMYSKRIVFRRNSFVHNRGFSSFGVLFQEDEECVADDNLVVDNEVGLFMEALRASRFRHNLIAANDTAIEAFASASGNTFEENNFVENLSLMWVVGKETGSHWSGSKAGNYWSEYEGYDLDADGIGDQPFKIQNVFQHLEGNYPRLRLYLLSPPAQALAVAEKTFPVIRGSHEFDYRPLMRPAPVAIRLPESDKQRQARVYSLLMSLLMVASSVTVVVSGLRKKASSGLGRAGLQPRRTTPST